jgi:hypothetical protein
VYSDGLELDYPEACVLRGFDNGGLPSDPLGAWTGLIEDLGMVRSSSRWWINVPFPIP